MSVLMHASNQWSNRPADQRFKSLDELHAAVVAYRKMSKEAKGVDIRSMRIASKAVEIVDGNTIVEPVLIGATGAEARFSNFSFGQFAARVGAPANYLRQLPAHLVVENLNHGIATSEKRENAESLLFAQNGGLMLRGMVTDKYTRIWNSDITSRLMRLTQQNPEWQPAPEAFDGSRGLYASDRDLFAFMVNNDRRIFETLPGGGLGRGFFVSNSEVGDGAFWIMTFMYEYVCGNHRVWGAKGVAELRIPHVGNADEKAFGKLAIELRKYADSSASDDELKIERAMKMTLGATKDDVLDKVFGLRVGVTKRLAASAYDLAEQRVDWYGDPRSVWGFTGALTEIARDLPNADERVTLDRAAGKLMEIAF